MVAAVRLTLPIPCASVTFGTARSTMSSSDPAAPPYNRFHQILSISKRSIDIRPTYSLSCGLSRIKQLRKILLRHPHRYPSLVKPLTGPWAEPPRKRQDSNPRSQLQAWRHGRRTCHNKANNSRLGHHGRKQISQFHPRGLLGANQPENHACHPLGLGNTVQVTPATEQHHYHSQDPIPNTQGAHNP